MRVANEGQLVGAPELEGVLEAAGAGAADGAASDFVPDAAPASDFDEAPPSPEALEPALAPSPEPVAAGGLAEE